MAERNASKIALDSSKSDFGLPRCRFNFCLFQKPSKSKGASTEKMAAGLERASQWPEAQYSEYTAAPVPPAEMPPTTLTALHYTIRGSKSRAAQCQN
jgi:hypothetical protein